MLTKSRKERRQGTEFGISSALNGCREVREHFAGVKHILVQFDLVFKSRADVLKDECYVLFELGAELLHQWSDVVDHTLVGVISMGSYFDYILHQGTDLESVSLQRGSQDRDCESVL